MCEVGKHAKCIDQNWKSLIVQRTKKAAKQNSRAVEKTEKGLS